MIHSNQIGIYYIIMKRHIIKYLIKSYQNSIKLFVWIHNIKFSILINFYDFWTYTLIYKNHGRYIS
jgi:hypothetical protein